MVTAAGKSFTRRGLAVGLSVAQPLIAQGGSNGVVRVYNPTRAMCLHLNQSAGPRLLRPWGVVAPEDEEARLEVPCVQPLWTSPKLPSTTATTFVVGAPSVVAVGTITPHLSVWDFERPQGTPLWECKMPSHCRFLAPRERGVILAGLSSGAVALVDLREKSGQFSLLCAPLNPGHRHVNAISAVAVDPRGCHRLFTGGVDGQIRSWDLRRGSSLLEIFNKRSLREVPIQLKDGDRTALPPPAHPQGVRGLSVSDDGLKMFSRGTRLRETLIWDLDRQDRFTCLPLDFDDDAAAPTRAAEAEEPDSMASMRSVFFGVEGRRSANDFILTSDDDGSLLAGETSSGLTCARWRDHLWDDNYPTNDELGRKAPNRPVGGVSLCADVLRHPGEGYVVATKTGDPCWYTVTNALPSSRTRICYERVGD